MVDENQFREHIRELYRNQNLGVLSTRGKDYPYSSLIGFAASDDLDYIIFATLRNTRKYANIQNSAKVSVLVDSRSNMIEDFRDAAALTILGEVHEAGGKERTMLAQQYLEKHPFLSDFILDPNCAILKLEVENYILVSNFQQVLELKIKK
jgi:hypothetical protein